MIIDIYDNLDELIIYIYNILIIIIDRIFDF